MAWDYGAYDQIGGERRTGGGVLVSVLSVLLGLGLLSLGALIALSLLPSSEGGSLGKLPPPHTPDPKWDPEPSQSLLGEYSYAAVSVDSIPCAKIGK